jgi:hypothetical protein
MYVALKYLVREKNGGDQMFEIIRAGAAFYYDPGVSLLCYQDPLPSIRTRLMHFPFENWIEDAMVS